MDFVARSIRHAIEMTILDPAPVPFDLALSQEERALCLRPVVLGEVAGQNLLTCEVDQQASAGAKRGVEILHDSSVVAGIFEVSE